MNFKQTLKEVVVTCFLILAICRPRIFFVLLIPSVYNLKILSNSFGFFTNHHSYDILYSVRQRLIVTKQITHSMDLIISWQLSIQKNPKVHLYVPDNLVPILKYINPIQFLWFILVLCSHQRIYKMIHPHCVQIMIKCAKLFIPNKAICYQSFFLPTDAKEDCFERSINILAPEFYI
jgi:hypothetical protein